MASLLRGWFSPLLIFLSIPFVLLITMPLGELLTSSGLSPLAKTIQDPQVHKALGRSLSTSLAAVWLVLVSFCLFVLMRLFSRPLESAYA